MLEIGRNKTSNSTVIIKQLIGIMTVEVPWVRALSAASEWNGGHSAIYLEMELLNSFCAPLAQRSGPQSAGVHNHAAAAVVRPTR